MNSQPISRSATDTYRTLTSKRKHLLILFIFILGLVFIVGVSFGTISIPIDSVIKAILNGIGFQLEVEYIYQIIIFNVRLPRVLIAILTGASLSVAGCIIQAIFRNPLASPYVLGLNSGASFAAGIAVIGVFGVAAYIVMPIVTFIGVIGVLFLTLGIAADRGVLNPSKLILAGVAIASFFTSLTSFTKYLAGEKLAVIVFWMLGGLTGLGWDELTIMFVTLIPLLTATVLLSGWLNTLLLGEEIAKGVGLNVNRVRWILFILVGGLVGITISYIGPVGFVGLVIPHMCRLLIGSDHRYLIPASILLGASFLVLVDLLARILIIPAELPLGAITGVIGAPYFIYLLKTRGKSLWW
ncbi:MAG: FecCD family ABC transporter permease [Candidatus Odinarchaeia archaeon]